jgi:hypothetical protein
MKLVYKQITRLNQWSWYWTDGYKFQTLEMRSLDEALQYGMNEGYIDSVPMYPVYEALFV